MRTSVRKAPQSVSMAEIGTSGLQAYGGIISEEKLRQLQGTLGVKTFAEMRDNDDTVGAVLFIIDKLLRNVEWTAKPADESDPAKECAEFLQSCMDDMDHAWSDFISEVLSMLVFGWSAIEMVYKYREGLDARDKTRISKFDDKKIGWRRLPLRSQESLSRWVMEENGDILAMEQYPPMGGNVKVIPIDKLLLFRTQSFKNSPQGRSILRNAYRPWFFKKRIEEIEGIGIERDLAGLPVAHVPPELLSEKATAEQKATLEAIKKLVKSIRRDEQEGIVFPRVYDENNNLLYELELLSTGGTRQFDTNTIITRYSKAIAMTVLADFIFLGQTKVGSYALSSDKTDMFSAGLGAWLKSIADVLNRVALPKLMKLNGYDRKVWPTFKPADIEKEDVAKFCDNIYKLVGVGALIPDDNVDKRVRELLNIPQSEQGEDVITPLSMLEDKLANDKKQTTTGFGNQPATPNGKDNPGIVKSKRRAVRA